MKIPVGHVEAGLRTYDNITMARRIMQQIQTLINKFLSNKNKPTNLEMKK